MLLQKKQELPYIGVFKLGSGEEFIAKVVNETETDITVTKPLCMVPTERGLSFAPLFMMGDMEAPVSLPKPIIQTKANEQLVSQYETSTTGIVLPKKSSIIA